MHLFYYGIPMYPGYPILPSYPTFVSAQNTAAMTPMSAPSTPLTTAQQMQNILSGSIQYTPSTTEVTPRYGTPIEATQALMSVRREQWSSTLGSIGGQIYPKLETQQRLMEREKNIMGQLQQMGYPVRPLTFR